MELAFDFSREDCPLLKDLGEIVEVLEGHALEMMGMVRGLSSPGNWQLYLVKDQSRACGRLIIL